MEYGVCIIVKQHLYATCIIQLTHNKSMAGLELGTN